MFPFAYFPSRSQSHEERGFSPRMSSPPEHAVILLGAGASAPANCPLMRGFIDRARDQLKRHLFTESEAVAVETALELYGSLRISLSITEEDIENVENLLSLADLSRVIKNPPLEMLSDPHLSDRLRRFIDAVITKSVNIPKPTSPAWLGPANVYAQLVRALAYLGNHVTVITVNYDCLLEYACSCMGLPYTYKRSYPGTEILKLHGSINWLRCPNLSCKGHAELKISPIRHVPHATDPDIGYIERCEKTCSICEEELTPLLVPPTWTKSMEDPILSETWSRAVRALADCETFVSVGYSLSDGDIHVRELLHMGFSSPKSQHMGFSPPKLQQALVVVGSDEDSARRWSSLFRQSWRQRVEIRQAKFESVVIPAILPALVIPESYGDHLSRDLLPVSEVIQNHEAIREGLRDALHHHKIDPGSGLGGIDWGHVAKELRAGVGTKHDNIILYRQILTDLGLSWTPSGPILPTHGNSFPSDT